ncbi:hypothetical protein SLEP1_g18303 [Rubroshorea leprosula]|uniref:C3H1-type domain-containing protein n=1 Tax=Rubroshorea leprosula TaxID=152421 RepID=A0AAV5J5Y0_9ROSI|nr:hypothetical protein SLEP1_g18303 [Rubroshorea leprosula]
MSYPESRSSYMQPMASAYEGSDAIGVWPQFAVNDSQFDPQLQYEEQQHQHQQPPFKRPRHSEDIQTDAVQCTLTNSRMPMNPPVNKGINNIFFKTRMCAKFRMGACRNGENCNFAHGMEDLRQPPPNWQELVGGREVGGREWDEERPMESWNDDQKIIHRMKLCKKFYNGEECPYGDRCNFLHEAPTRYRDDSMKFRESSAISIGTTGASLGCGSGSNQSEGNRPLNSSTGSDALRASTKPVYWKTKLCMKWEITGHCPFGEKCHFAHGQSELQGPVGVRFEAEIASTVSNPARTGTGSISTKTLPLPANDASPVNTTTVPTLNDEGQDKKCLFKWKGPRKINRIYGDWLDDMPLVHNFPSEVEI